MLDFLTSLLFESLPLLLAAVAVALAVAIAVHRQRRTDRSRRGLFITLGVCAALVLVQNLVVTDREALETLVVRMARAVDQGDIGALGEHVDDGFAGQAMDKAELLARANATLQRWQVDEPRIGAVRPEVDGDAATVSFRVVCDLRSDSATQYNTMSHWKLHCVRRPDGWRMDRIISAVMGLTPQNGINILQHFD